MTDVLGRSVIEIGVDDMRLADEMSGAQRTIAKSLSESLNRTKLEKNERLKLYEITKSLAHLDMSRVKMQAVATERVNKSLRQQLNTAKEISKVQFSPAARALLHGTWRERFKQWNETEPDKAPYSRLKAGASIAGGLALGSAGIAYAAAAMSGTTALDTLTGSLKMLSLSAGSSTQGAVLKLSKMIQQLSKVVDQTSPETVSGIMGALAGGALGYRFGGVRGAVFGGGAGAAVAGGSQSLSYGAMGAAIGSIFGPAGTLLGFAAGDLVGTIRETKFTGDYVKDLAYKMARDPEKAAKGLARAAVLEKQGGNGKDAAEMLRNAVVESEKMRLADPDSFKKAGLGGVGAYVGLSDLRQQTQIAGFGPGGVLGLENEMKLMNVNLEALNDNLGNNIQKAQPNVAPPGG